MSVVPVQSVGMSSEAGTCEAVPVFLRGGEDPSPAFSLNDPGDDWQKLIEGKRGTSFWPYMAGTTQAVPFNRNECAGSFYIAFLSLAIHLSLGKTAWYFIGSLHNPEKYEAKLVKDGRKLLDLEMIFLMQHVLARALVFLPPIFPLIRGISDRFVSLGDLHYALWTPMGLRSSLKKAWDDCGRPGGKMAEEIRIGWQRFFPKPAETSIQKRTVPLPSIPPEWTGAWVAAAAATAAVLKSLDIALGRATGLWILTPGNSLTLFPHSGDEANL